MEMRIINNNTMKFINIVCRDCLKKIRKLWVQEKRARRLKIKQGKQVSGKVKVRK